MKVMSEKKRRKRRGKQALEKKNMNEEKEKEA